MYFYKHFSNKLNTSDSTMLFFRKQKDQNDILFNFLASIVILFDLGCADN